METLFEFPNPGEVTQLINNTRQRGKPLQERCPCAIDSDCCKLRCDRDGESSRWRCGKRRRTNPRAREGRHGSERHLRRRWWRITDSDSATFFISNSYFFAKVDPRSRRFLAEFKMVIRFPCNVSRCSPCPSGLSADPCFHHVPPP